MICLIYGNVHFVISERLVAQIDTLVGKRGRSHFLSQAAEKELMRLRQIKTLEAAAGTWKDKDHPELKQGAAKWVKKLRREYDRRLQRLYLSADMAAFLP